MIVISFLIFLLRIYSFILLARVLLSWIPNLDYNNPIVQFLYQLTEPVLRPIRQALPQASGIDFSPIVVFIGISVLTTILTMGF